MTSVRFVFPKPKLAELLRTPGGMPVAEALAQANANLLEIRPSCVGELQTLLDYAEAAFGVIGAEFDDDGMAGLYAIAVRAIGAGAVCGVPAVDVALTSLCDLLDHLRTNHRFDREAIGVHVRAWRLLMTPGLPIGGSDAVLNGLRQVSARYAAA
jgi:hypothetical protein